ncbi:ABC transporter substrate-binding protein [Deinococcus frigens]|uniref:ABC transporter substrate-binding protein n=1 Tax=Deinococcus frigens TaxID=249403 RepID=UPI000495353B|nr:ABC transporter substrate-binding protein [Deinococcus frigens]
MKRLFLTAALSGLSLSSAQTASADLSGTLTLYTSEVQADVQAQVDAFKKLYPRAEVQLFRSGTGEVTAKLNAELEAGNSQADLLWVADQTYFDTLSKRTLLEKLDLSGLNVPGNAVYGGTYAEVRKLYNVIGVNTNVLKTAPKSFADLKQPAYQNKLAMPNPLFSGGALSTAGTLAQRLGWDYFDALAKNGMKIEQSNPITTTKLIGGEYGAALLVDYALRREAAKGAPIQIVYPTEGAILVPTPIGVLKSSKNKALAQAFVRFLYSPAAQTNFSRLSYVPVMPSAPRPAGVPASVPTLPSAAAYIAANKAEIGQRFSALFDLK